MLVPVQNAIIVATQVIWLETAPLEAGSESVVEPESGLEWACPVEHTALLDSAEGYLAVPGRRPVTSAVGLTIMLGIARLKR